MARKAVEQTPAPIKRLVVGITGASGVVCGVRLLEMLRGRDVETHLVISKAGEMALAYETGRKAKDVRKLASVNYAVGDIGSAIASGSFETMGMVILPCSIKTMSEIATGVTATLLSRAGDVTLKEKRRLVLGLRESPLHGGHLRNLALLSDLGAIIAPIVPVYYSRPKTVDDIVDQTAARMLDYFGLGTDLLERWTGENPKSKAGNSDE